MLVLKKQSIFHSVVQVLGDSRFDSSVFPLDFNSLWDFSLFIDLGFSWECVFRLILFLGANYPFRDVGISFSVFLLHID